MWQRLLALFLTSLSFLAQSQVTQNITPQQQRQIEQLNVDRDRFSTPLPAMPGVDLRILTPEKAPVPRAVDELEFQITRVDVEGAAYFSRVEIDALFLPLLNRAVNLSALRDAAVVLEQKYRERGFFLVRVFIPPQQIKDGIFRVRVVEGYISDVFMEGADELSNERVKTFASNLIGIRPLSLGELERTLLLINDLLGVSASAVLRPGQELGTSDLLLTVKTADPTHILTFNNSGSKTTGPFSLSYNATLIQPFKTPGQLNVSLTGAGANFGNLINFGVDSSGLNIGKMEGMHSMVSRYSQALGNRGLMFSFSNTLSESKPGGILTDLEIKSTSSVVAPRLRYAIQRSRLSSVFLEAGLALNEAKTTLSGLDLTEDRSTVADISAAWVLNGWLDGTQNISLGLSHGVSGLGAMDKMAIRPSTVDFTPNFTKYTLNFQRTQKLDDEYSISVVAMGQYAKDRLLVAERLAFGGSSVGRAFAAAIISGDRGIGGVVELRRDLKLPNHPNIANVQVFASLDSASVMNNSSARVTSSFSNLSSKSIGVRFSAYKDTYGELRMAHSTQSLATDDTNRSKRLLLEIIRRF